MADRGAPADKRKRRKGAPRNVRPERASRILERRRENPHDDWTIRDIQKVCRQLAINCSNPTHGSHYKVSSEVLAGALPIPARRPIKPIYIKQFVVLADSHLKHSRKDRKDD